MDKLKTTEFYPSAKEGNSDAPKGDPARKDEGLPKYSEGLLRWLEKEIWYRLSRRINYLLDRANDNHFELIKPGNTGPEQSGNVRFTFDSNDDIIMQYYSGTAWVDTGFIWDVTP